MIKWIRMGDEKIWHAVEDFCFYSFVADNGVMTLCGVPAGPMVLFSTKKLEEICDPIHVMQQERCKCCTREDNERRAERQRSKFV